MKLTPRRLRLALRSPGHFRYAVGLVLRASRFGRLEERCLRGYAFRPNLIAINITGRCNLCCSMCIQSRDKAGQDAAVVRPGETVMSPEDWMRVVDQAAPAHCAFYLSGGEPLLYKGIDRLLEHIKGKGLIASIVTNGTILDRFAETFVRIGLDNVTVSIDGPQPVHDRIRGVPGTFDRAAAGIAALKRAREAAGAAYPSIKVNCVITPDSIPWLEETYDVAAAWGVDEISYQHPIFDSRENFERHNREFPRALERGGVDPAAVGDPVKVEGEFYELEIDDDTLQQLESAAARIENRPGGPRVVFFPHIARSQWRGYYTDLEHPFGDRCNSPWLRMRLLADGTFEPCLHYQVGNVHDVPLWDLWNHDLTRRFRRSVATGLYPACVRCCLRCF